MKSATIAGVVAMLVSSASATAAFVVTSKNIKNGTIHNVDLSAKAKKALKGNVGPAGARSSRTGRSGWVRRATEGQRDIRRPVEHCGIAPDRLSLPARASSAAASSQTRKGSRSDAPSGTGAANNVAGIEPGGITVYARAGCSRPRIGVRRLTSD